MKNIKLINLKLTNFKGIESFNLELAGSDSKVFGGNATGKTTLFDGFVWLLFDKDSNNRSTSNFNIKTLVDGKPVSKLDHEVEALLDVDGDEITLRKVYKEVWSKKRGSSTESFTGHTTNYYVNEVPSKKKEYDEYIKWLVDEDVFKLLTSPNYFNEVMSWKERRDLLIEIAGNITDEDVIATDDNLMQLLGVLKGNSIDDHKKIIAAKRRDINKEIDSIIIRVDESNHNKPEAPELTEIELNKKVTKLNELIEKENKSISGVRNGSEVIEVKKAISENEIKLNSVRAEHEKEGQEGAYKSKARLSEEETNLDLLRDSVRPLVQTVKTDNEMIEFNKEQMNKLRMNYAELNKKSDEISSQAFDEHSKNCPTCSQLLPEEEIEKARAAYNKNKSDELDVIAEEQKEINKEGLNLKIEVETSESEVEKAEKEIEKITKQAEKKVRDIEKLKKEIESSEGLIQPIEDNLKYIAITKDIKDLESKIDEINKSVESVITKHEEEIAILEADKKELQIDLNSLQGIKDVELRIKELEAKEKRLASEYEQLEHELHLTEEFTRKKVDMLNEKINNKFKYARFDLFKENINGGLEEICETTYKGVPFASGLNNAAKINVGLDIINTLSEHYNVKAPIWIDNAESVTDLINVKAQLISLIVSKDDKILRVESN